MCSPYGHDVAESASHILFVLSSYHKSKLATPAGEQIIPLRNFVSLPALALLGPALALCGGRPLLLSNMILMGSRRAFKMGVGSSSRLVIIHKYIGQGVEK